MQELLVSTHDLSDGGLGVALAEATFGNAVGAEINIESDELTAEQMLFSESHSRFIISVDPELKDAFEDVLGEDATLIGRVTDDSKIKLKFNKKMVVELEKKKLLEAWQGGLVF